jgi:hypothetical protein
MSKDIKEIKKSDYDKVEVTSSGDFFMTSENIFRNKEKSLKLISDLKTAVKSYRRRQRFTTLPKK